MGNAMRLPSINTVEEFSGFLGIPKEVLTKLIFTSDLRYKEFKIKKKSGNGYRLISAPSRTLKGIQRWIDVFILRKVPISEAGTAFQMGRAS